MEVEARENAALLHEVIMGLEDRFGITKMMDLRELKKECHAEAAEIVAHLAEDHAPPMPVFGDSSPSEGETTFGDDVYKDDVLAEGGGDDRYGENERRRKSRRRPRRRPAADGGTARGLQKVADRPRGLAGRVVGHAARGFAKDVAGLRLRHLPPGRGPGHAR